MSVTPGADLTAAVITFNSESYIADCLNSLLEAGLRSSEILVVDDGSTDRTLAILRRRYPGIEVLAEGRNRGHSHACNLALKHCASRWVVLIDHDTVVDVRWLSELRAALRKDPDCALVVSRAVFEGRRDTIHSDGGDAHFLGNMTLRNGFSPMREAGNDSAQLGAAGTTCMAVNRQWAQRVGYFDEAFFIYLNDFEFSLRIRMAGGQIACAPGSVIYHKAGTPSVSYRGQSAYPALRGYLILRNRWFLLLKLYEVRTLLLIAPALVVYEPLVLAMAVKKGMTFPYLRALGWLISHFPLVLRHRKAAQALRTVPDARLLSAQPMTFVPGLIRGRCGAWLKSALDRFFCFYWRQVSKIL